jgi:hypothetical protein
MELPPATVVGLAVRLLVVVNLRSVAALAKEVSRQAAVTVSRNVLIRYDFMLSFL